MRVNATMASRPQADGQGGSAWLDSCCQFIGGVWRIADYAGVRRVVHFAITEVGENQR
jgi:hypothetical protein